MRYARRYKSWKIKSLRNLKNYFWIIPHFRSYPWSNLWNDSEKFLQDKLDELRDNFFGTTPWHINVWFSIFTILRQNLNYYRGYLYYKCFELNWLNRRGNTKSAAWRWLAYGTPPLYDSALARRSMDRWRRGVAAHMSSPFPRAL